MLMFVRADVCVCNIWVYAQLHNTNFWNNDPPTLLFNYMITQKMAFQICYLSTTNAINRKAGYMIHIHNTKFIRTMHTCLCLCAHMHAHVHVRNHTCAIARTAGWINTHMCITIPECIRVYTMRVHVCVRSCVNSCVCARVHAWTLYMRTCLNAYVRVRARKCMRTVKYYARIHASMNTRARTHTRVYTHAHPHVVRTTLRCVPRARDVCGRAVNVHAR